MQRVMNKFCYFFLVMILFSVTFRTLAKSEHPPTTITSISASIPILPDEDSVVLNTILSAIGGFGGGGLFLIFLIRRLVTSYDASFNKWEIRCSNHQASQDDKNNKIMLMIKDLHGIAQDLKLEVVKIQANTMDKDSITEALTKVDMMETDIDHVRNEVKSIVNHLLNKPKLVNDIERGSKG
jgi:hypothetical protein